MRKLMAMFAICSVVASTPSWALFGLGDMKFDGSLEVRGNSANNETDFSPSNDHRGNTATRMRLGVGMTVTEGVQGRLELTRTPRVYGTGATTVAGEEALWTFNNAYAQIDDLWGMVARLGRQYVGEPGDLVWHIGPKSDDSLTITSIDGLMLHCPDQKNTGTFMDKLHLMLFTGKQASASANPAATAATASGDINLSDIELKVVDVIPNGRIRAGVMLGDAANTAAVSDNNHLKIARLGVNGGVSENMFTYRAEYLQNFGQQNRPHVGTVSDLKYKGNAIDLGAGFNSKDTSAGTFGLWANWVQASGDDKNDNDDKAFHDFSTLGTNTSDRYFGEIFGKSNTLGGGTPIGQGVDSGIEGQGLRVLNIGLKFNPAMWKKWWAKLDYFNLTRPKDTLNNVNVGNKFGDEWDLTLGYNHSDNVGLEAGYATLKPKEALTGTGSNVNDDPVTKLFARANIKWGGEEK